MKKNVVVTVILGSMIFGRLIAQNNSNQLQQMDKLCDHLWKGDNGKFKVEVSYKWAPSKRMINSTLRFLSYDGKEMGYHDGCFIWDELQGKITFWDVDKETGKLQPGIGWFENNVLYEKIFTDGSKEKFYLTKVEFLDGDKFAMSWLEFPDGSKGTGSPITYTKAGKP